MLIVWRGIYGLCIWDVLNVLFFAFICLFDFLAAL